MRQGVSLIGALAAGFVGGFLGGYLAAAPGATEEAATGPAGRSRGDLEKTLARLEARVDGIAESARRARAGDAPHAPAPTVAPDADPQAASGGSTEDAPSPDAGKSSSADSAPPDALRDLERRVTALEKSGRGGTVIPDDLAHLPVAEATALLRNLMTEKRNADLLRVADELLRRGDLSADERMDVDLNGGYALRGLGRHADAEARFREIQARVGEDTQQGAWVGFQVGWERYYQKDPAGASAVMERSADNAAVAPLVRVHSLYNAGRFAKESGDAVRARRLLERLLRDHAADIPASQAFMRTETERLLKELEGG